MDLRLASIGVVALASLVACGARSSLGTPDGSGGAPTTNPTGGAGGTGGTAGQGGVLPPCVDGETIPCGSSVGVCKPGLRTCQAGAFGPCEGAVGPFEEQCNGVDDNCDGQIDEGFNLGAPCDDPDGDLCLDSVITCDGCSMSTTNLEVCNGIDDNCNGIIDADCDIGDCQPSLEVTGSTPSNPNCVDLPVEKGSSGIITYPCAGGPVSATLGSITFTGSVTNGFVSLQGVATVTGPDNCLWKNTHTIQGNISSGQLTYGYKEELLTPGPGCWSPCTEVGTVKVTWAATP